MFHMEHHRRAAEVSRDKDTSQKSWQFNTRGIQVGLTQISSDQARAFYQARDLTPEQAKQYASSCVIMTVVRNIGIKLIKHRPSNWHHVDDDGTSRSIRSKTEWEKI